MIFESRAYARAGLLGNPSDGYFGKTISIVVRNFGAHVSLYESPELQIEQQKEDDQQKRDIAHAGDRYLDLASFFLARWFHGYSSSSTIATTPPLELIAART